MAGRAPGDLVSKKNTTSAVWEYFGFQANEKGEPVNTDEAICKLQSQPPTHCCEDEFGS